MKVSFQCEKWCYVVDQQGDVAACGLKGGCGMGVLTTRRLALLTLMAALVLGGCDQLTGSSGSPLAMISASEIQVEPGTEVLIAWEVANASQAVLETRTTGTISDVVSAKGSRTVLIQESTTFSITAKSDDGAELVSQSVTVSITGSPAPAPGSMLWPSRTRVPAGGEVAIYWDATQNEGALGAELSMEPEGLPAVTEAVALEGSQQFAVDVATAFTLTMLGAGDQVLDRYTVRVEVGQPFTEVQLAWTVEVDARWTEEVAAFDARGTTNIDAIAWVAWDFGDGSTLVLRNDDPDWLTPVHRYGYAPPTSYQVILTAYNDAGDARELARTVRVVPNRVKAIAAGAHHTMLLRDDGTVWTFGSNETGQLGTGDIDNRGHLMQVSTETGLTHAIAIAAGWQHSLALDSNGDVWAWGNGEQGALGLGLDPVAEGADPVYRVPARVESLSDMTAIFAGFNGSAAVDEHGRLWMWGASTTGQAGRNTNQYLPVLIDYSAGLGSVRQVALGRYHTLALDDRGVMWGWGANTVGQSGNEAWQVSLVPRLVSQESGLGTGLAVAAGISHSLVLSADRNPWTFGSNLSGQLGTDEDLDFRLLPGQVELDELPDSFEAITANGDFNMALAANGTLWSWGSNSCAQLGDGTNIDRAFPIQVEMPPEMPRPVAIAAGYVHSVALAADGTVWTWGWNVYGQGGNGHTYVGGRPGPIRTPDDD